MTDVFMCPLMLQLVHIKRNLNYCYYIYHFTHCWIGCSPSDTINNLFDYFIYLLITFCIVYGKSNCGAMLWRQYKVDQHVLTTVTPPLVRCPLWDGRGGD